MICDCRWAIGVGMVAALFVWLWWEYYKAVKERTEKEVKK